MFLLEWSTILIKQLNLTVKLRRKKTFISTSFLVQIIDNEEFITRSRLLLNHYCRTVSTKTSLRDFPLKKENKKNCYLTTEEQKKIPQGWEIRLCRRLNSLYSLLPIKIANTLGIRQRLCLRSKYRRRALIPLREYCPSTLKQ